MSVFLAVLIGTVALILAPGQMFYYDVTPKLAVLLAGAAVLCLVRPGTSARRFSLLLAATLASAALATAISPDPALSLYGSTWRRYGLVAQFAVVVVAWFVSQSSERPTIVRGIAIASTAAALFGIAQYFGWDPILRASAYHIGEGVWTIVRPPGTFGYVSYFATWLLMAGFLSLELRNTAGRIAAGICWSAMLLTGTRAALLGLAAGVLFWMFRRGLRPSRRAIAVSAIALAAAGAFYWSPAGRNLRSRARWSAEDPWGGARPLLWRDSLRMAATRLPAGHGPETFTGTFPHFESAELARAYPDFAHESPHNIFLDALVSQGIPGLLCLAALCAVGLCARDPWIAAAVAAGVVAQQFTVFTIPTALLFYVTVALAVPEDDNAIRVPRFALAPGAVAFLLVAFRVTAADHSLAQAQRAIDAADLQAADQHYREYRRQRLPGTDADLWCSRALLALSQRSPDPLRRFQALQMADAVAESGADRAEDPFNAWYNVATICAAQGDAAGTERALRRSIAAKPNWFKPHWTLARLLRIEGRASEALTEARTAVDLNGGKDAEVAATLAELRAASH
jgi:O-antigen ligase